MTTCGLFNEPLITSIPGCIITDSPVVYTQVQFHGPAASRHKSLAEKLTI